MLRRRENRRYNEENNDEDDGGRKYDLREKIRSERFDQDKEKHLQELSGQELTLKLVQSHGFERPILVTEQEGLDLRVPPRTFLVRNVRDCVGPDRVVDVMDVRTQKNIEMTMKEWCKYYESRHRDRLLNVISLEFSHTDLDGLVESPSIVKQLDWVDLVWPKFLKESQTESTNKIDRMRYPKVQKYCLMSVKGSYTDFHIDFGGTSVWYHILKGKKIFWMVPPTELNLQTFEEWTLSGMQQDVFFGDTVEECIRVELTAGNTFFIPSGWIHAVYTLEDSLVFGGNFLHSFGIENQLKVSKIEDATKVPLKFRYPFYTEILWYVVQHYVHCLTGKQHLRPEAIAATLEKMRDNNFKSKDVKIEDESTETDSDPEQSDKGKRGRPPAKRGRGRPRGSKKKVKQPSTDDDSTEIDSSTEDSKLPEKKNTATCRMTKNSLLRLQYEVEEQASRSQTSGSESPSKSKNARSESDAPRSSADDKNRLSQSTVESNTPVSQNSSINLLGPVLSQDTTNFNGWPQRTSGHTTWLDEVPESKDPPRFHITRYEINGLKLLVKHLSKLSGTKKNLPNLIRNSRVLLDDCKKMIADHENDDPKLACTGRPITLELLTCKKSSINELIEQFFKPVDSSEADNSEPQLQNATLKFKSDALTQQQRLKYQSNQEIPSAKSEDKTSHDGGTSPHKDSKSPSKKTLNLTPPNVGSLVSPPQRPKSPPTRPLSNNQYTGRIIKEDKGLMLPDSFADLIAATSTEKKVFDISGTEVASSLFGKKEQSSPVKSNQPSSDIAKDNVKQESATSTMPVKPRGPPKKSKEAREVIPCSSDVAETVVKPKSNATGDHKDDIEENDKPNSKRIKRSPEDNCPSIITSQRLIYPAPGPTMAPKPQPAPTPRLVIASTPKPPSPTASRPQLVMARAAALATYKQTMTPVSRSSAATVPKPAPMSSPVISSTPQPTTAPTPIPVFKPSPIPTSKASIIVPPKPAAVVTPKSAPAPKSTLAPKPSVAPKPVSTPKSTSAPKPATAPKPTPAFRSNAPPKPAATSKQITTTATTIPITATQVNRPPVICGLVAPPLSTAPLNIPHKLNAHPYLISRPLMLNSMPALSTAQLHMSRASLPLLTTTVPTSMGMPRMQQGARIVWATQPRVMRPAQAIPMTNNATGTAPMSTISRSQTPTTFRRPLDNSALLSLATTALSTAPLTSTPALNSIGSTRPPATQAIMVSSAGARPTLFAGQQFFNPFVQRLPMGQFATPMGIPRPTGQLVYARLPNQNQPRYLITQPGFFPQRPQMPLVAGQPATAMTFPTFAATVSDPTKNVKTKKVKTS